jgi:hypothetical protein
VISLISSIVTTHVSRGSDRSLTTLRRSIEVAVGTTIGHTEVVMAQELVRSITNVTLLSNQYFSLASHNQYGASKHS